MRNAALPTIQPFQQYNLSSNTALPAIQPVQQHSFFSNTALPTIQPFQQHSLLVSYKTPHHAPCQTCAVSAQSPRVFIQVTLPTATLFEVGMGWQAAGGLVAADDAQRRACLHHALLHVCRRVIQHVVQDGAGLLNGGGADAVKRLGGGVWGWRDCGGLGGGGVGWLVGEGHDERPGDSEG